MSLTQKVELLDKLGGGESAFILLAGFGAAEGFIKEHRQITKEELWALWDWQGGLEVRTLASKSSSLGSNPDAAINCHSGVSQAE